jgi:hypothetical protein
MPYAKSIPFEQVVPAWPDHLFSAPPAGSLAIVGYEVVEQGDTCSAWVDLAVASDLTLSIAGLEGFELVLPGDPENPLRCSATLGGTFEARIDGFDVILRIRSDLLVPLSGSAPDWVPLLDGEGRPLPLELAMKIGSLVVDESLQPRFEPDGSLALGAFMVGDTGIVVEASGVRPVLSANEPPPTGLQPGFRGLAIESATVHLPDAFAVGGLLPGSIALTGLAIGHGGLSGALTGAWPPVWTGIVPSGPGAGSLLGMAFALRTLGIVLAQNSVTGASLTGELLIPFFDERVDVAVQIGSDGAMLVEVTGSATAERTPSGLATVHKAGIGTFELTAVGLVRDAAGDALLLSGRLTLEVAAPAVQWPTLELQDLRIGVDGKVGLPGGWLDLQQPLALDLYGFGMEITRIGLGNDDDGRRWIGVDGAIRLTEQLPAGASARGLRVLWDPGASLPLPTLELDGVGISFGVPGAFAFEGEVALADDPAGGGKLFTGALGLGLQALDIGIDAGVTIGRIAPDTYVFVHLGVNLPIPLAASGTALYGLQGLFAMNMSPLVSNAGWPPDSDPPTVPARDWYGWYKQVPQAFAVTDPFKWSADPGGWAFGAGLSVGTLADAGWSVNTKALLVVLLPGPVILLEGKADLFKLPAALGSSTEEGTLDLLAALDGGAGTLQLGIDAAWSLSRVVDIAAATEAYFDFDRSDAWHLYIGQDQPAAARIRADLLALFHADAWLMLDAKGVATGGGVSFGDSWKFGPARVTLASWILARAALSTRPPQLAGQFELGGQAAIEAGPFGVGIGVQATLEGQSPTPYRVAGTLSVVLELPKPLKDLDVDIRLEWSQDATPHIDDPWVAGLLEHERCTESWLPLSGGSTSDPPAADAPVVPLDAGLLLSFAKAMGDDTGVADIPPAAAPIQQLGDCEACHTLTGVRLHRWRRSHPAAGWQDVTDSLFGSWAPDAGHAGGAGSRLQLLASSPFAFTRCTSRRWTDAFLAAFPHWPCTPQPPLEPECIDWADVPVETRLPVLWQQGAASLASTATLTVGDGQTPGRVLHLGAENAATDPQPGTLWVGLPAAAAWVSAQVTVPGGDWVLLRAWAGDQPLGSDLRVLGSGELRVEAAGIDALTLGWSAHGEATLSRICWLTQAQADAAAAWDNRTDHLEAAAQRWQSSEAVLDPDSHYLLEVDTRSLLTQDGREVQRVEATHGLQFQTGGPPGIVPVWLPAQTADESAPASPQVTSVGAFPCGGVLADLAAYVRWIVPQAGALGVFRAYDTGCEFDATTVQQMYGSDMGVRLRDANGAPVLDAEGAELVFENQWAEAPTTTLTDSQATWLSQLDACTGAVQWAALQGDWQLHTQVPGLLYDDFSGTLATAWTAYVLDAAETRAANWHLDAGTLRQDVAIAGGDPAPEAPDKPGTVYIGSGVATADVAVQTLAWAAAGAYGLVFRWQSPADYWRFSLGAQRARLAKVRAGTVTELWSAEPGYTAGRPTLLAVQAEGPRVRCQVDERLLCDVLDLDPEGIPNAVTAGLVGLYTWNSGSAAFDEVRARAWPGSALAPATPYTAQLEASRPLFTDALDNLDAFEQQLLATGAAVNSCSAAGGVATIARKAAAAGAVVALAGDPQAADYAVECNARPDGPGTFGLVARHTATASYLSLELAVGGGRQLVAHMGLTDHLSQVRVLWQDDGAVEVGRGYALALCCVGSSVTAIIDGEEFGATTSLTEGRFGLHSAIAAPAGCACSDLVVRSAPRVPVHAWGFTTGRHLGLPDLLDSFVGRTWRVHATVPNGAAFGTQCDASALLRAAADSNLDAARAALADAVGGGAAVEVEGLREAAAAAAMSRHVGAAQTYDALAAALGLKWRPTPPVVEIGTVDTGGAVLAWVLDLPAPLPWERMAWSVRGPEGDQTDVLLAWSDDGSHALLARAGGTAFAAGPWNLDLALRLDVGDERAVWRRGGSSAPEVGTLRFAL